MLVPAAESRQATAGCARHRHVRVKRQKSAETEMRISRRLEIEQGKAGEPAG